ncbi:DUF1552 domain-containing protein [Candidatus Rariloculus sp.]|uniref:DUF1552 domain-containing protein n=1 Tax=Candidatus Rariloculus sp. TaxID=3101265 RepID=UPI003D0FBD17
MRYVTRKSIGRRTFLRGAGAAVALPMLDAMVPAFGQAPAPIPRLGFVYVGNGIIHDDWKPATTGRDFALPPNLRPLASVRDQMNVLTGLSHLEADSKGDGSGDHTRACAAWLTGVHVSDRTRPGVEVKVATSADQLAAQKIGGDSPIQSLELTVETPQQGSCDSGDCFYVNTVSWRNESTPNVTEIHPRVVFERLFGDGGTSAERLARVRRTGSLLDSVNAEARQLAGKLSGGDQSKIHEYLDTVREIERRIQNAEARGERAIELPGRPTSIPDTFEAHTGLMFDLQRLAFQTDSTRVFSMIYARELSGRSYAQIGVGGNHHGVSHHRDDRAQMALKSRIDTHNLRVFAPFIEQLAATPDGDGSLLDQSLIVYGGGMGNGNLHRHSDIPCLTFGSLGGRIETGQHLAYEMDTPMCNFHVTMLQNVDVEIEQFGDSSGALDLSG